MARKFKVGDIVEVVRRVGIVPLREDFGEGCHGVIVEYNKGEDYPYVANKLKSECEICSDFDACELKLIKRGK